jgi:hypothetical protein
MAGVHRPAQRRLRPGGRHAGPAGHRHGLDHGLGNRVDHGLAPAGQGRGGLGHERHTRQVGRALGVAVLGSILASSTARPSSPHCGARRRRSPRPPARGSGPPPPSPRSWGRRARASWKPPGRPLSRAWATPSRSALGRPRWRPCWCCCSSPRGQPEARRNPAGQRSRSRPGRCKDSLTDDFLEGAGFPPPPELGALDRRKRGRLVLPGRCHPAVRRLGWVPTAAIQPPANAKRR